MDKLNISLLANATAFLKEKAYVPVVHDCSALRKPFSEELEGLGKVKDLDGKLVNGYDSFESIAVSFRGSRLRLLQCTPFSNGDEAYVSQQECRAIENGQLKDKERLAQMGGGKGKVTQHFVLKGIERLAHYQQMQQFVKEHQLSDNQINQGLALFNLVS